MLAEFSLQENLVLLVYILLSQEMAENLETGVGEGIELLFELMSFD